MADDEAPTDDAILSRALELQAIDEAAEDRATEREAQAEALAELGVSPEYLLRAEEELHRQQLDEQNKQAERKRKTINIVLGVLILGVVASFAYSPPVPDATPWSQNFDHTESDWSVVVSPGTVALAAHFDDPERGAVTRFTVKRFSAETAKRGRYYANLRVNDAPESLSGLSTMRIWVRGEGLTATRIYIRESKSKRWRSQAINLTDTWTQHTLSLKSFDYQVRDKKSWSDGGQRDLTSVERIQLKVGYFINEADASGSVYFDDLEVLK